MNDARRAAVYAAEDQLGSLLDRGGRLDFHGSVLDLPRQRRLADLAAVEDYLAAMRRQHWGASHTPPPRVRARRGTRRAHWEAPDTIALPPTTDWALRELVILHEYAHHVTWHDHGKADHGPNFQDTLTELVSHAIAPAAALVLRAAYHGSGARPQASSDTADATRGESG